MANADIAVAALIKDCHLGLLAESLVEADQLVQIVRPKTISAWPEIMRIMTM